MPITNLPNTPGLRLFTVPYYGHGWGWTDPAGRQTASLGQSWPEPFWIADPHLIQIANTVVGVSGRIDQPEHEFNGQTATCCLRFDESVDLKGSCGECMIWISKGAPNILPSPDQPVFLWVSAKEQMLIGYGTLALEPRFAEKRLEQVDLAKKYRDSLKQ